MIYSSKASQLERWHRWFAWYPVTLEDGRRAWMETVERIGKWNSNWAAPRWGFTYRPVVGRT